MVGGSHGAPLDQMLLLRLRAGNYQQGYKGDNHLMIFLHIFSDRIYRIIRIIFFATFRKKVAKLNPPEAE